VVVDIKLREIPFGLDAHVSGIVDSNLAGV
jgi:hypothetical protein